MGTRICPRWPDESGPLVAPTP